ncbi:MAG: hypothetical protein J6N45_08350 [Alphaproteobacteria bacterium]|nr:hypothetical protein [Alphaproteobacteria bacterium]
MRHAPQRQFSYSAGQLDRAMVARADIDSYLKGALELKNVVCIPSGGVTLRGGLVRDFEILDGANGIRLDRFEVSPEIGLLVLLTQNKLKIYNGSTLVGEKNTSYSGADLAELDLNQKMDTMIITSKYYPFMELVRQGSNTSWNYAQLDLDNPPQYTFDDTTGGRNEIQQVIFKNFVANDTIRISLDGSRTVSIVYSASATETADNIKNAINELDVVDGTDGGCVLTIIDSNTYQVEFVGTDGKQDKPDMIAAIELQANTNEQVVVKCVQEGEAPHENLFSVARGWPYSSCFCQGRLIFGGNYTVAYMINGSMTNNQFNFKTTSQNLDDEAFSMSADTDGNCEVRRVYAMEKLFALTNKGVFAVKEMPITPGTSCNKQTDTPCAPVRPKEIDGSLIYVTQNSEGINQTVASLTYTYENEKYKTDDLAYLVPSIMREPKRIDVRRSIKRNHATYLFVVNADGTLAVLNSKQSQGLNGWSLCETNGKFLDVCVINDITYFAVKRDIGGQTRYFIEHWDDDAKLDLEVTLTSTTAKSVWTDSKLAYFEGLEVGVYADGLPYGTATITNNTLTLDFPVSEVEVGLPFDWATESMPAVVETEDYTLTGKNYRVPVVGVQLQNTAGIIVNGVQICNRYFGKNAWDTDDMFVTGTKIVKQLGWFADKEGREATVRCSGTSLQPATILSTTMEVYY